MNGIAFSAVTDPGVTSNEAGPYSVSATIVPSFAAPIQEAKIHYRVNGGPFVDPPVNMTSGGGNTWTGTIPGQQSPAVIEYYLSAKDSTVIGASAVGQVVEHPVQIMVTQDGKYSDEGSFPPLDATPTYLRFFVGIKQVLFVDIFESGPGNWVEGGQFEDWELGDPTGAGSTIFIPWSDPQGAYSGVNCRGNDLGLVDADGAYENDRDTWLQTPLSSST